MLAFHSSLKVFLASEPVDMRKSFGGLYSIVLNQLKEEPTSGAFFVFINKNLNRLKILYFDGSGLWVFAKRLEQGRFSWPKGSNSDGKINLTPEALHLLVSGIDMKQGCKKAWYER